MRLLSRWMSGALAGTVAVSTALIGAGSAQAAETTQVYAVHRRITGVTVDVWLDGAPAIPNFAPLTTAVPLDLPSGPHSIAIAPAGQPAWPRSPPRTPVRPGPACRSSPT